MPDDDSPFGSPAGGPLLPADVIYRRLTPFVGPNVTRMAIRTFAQKTLNVGPEKITRDNVKELVTALRPLLRTMLGDAHAERMLQELQQEFSK